MAYLSYMFGIIAECSDCGDLFPIVDGICVPLVESDGRNRVTACWQALRHEIRDEIR